MVKIMRLENAVASDVLERILSAYGFTMQKELSDRLEIAKSNVASWLARGHVPGNVIVQCSLDTGADVNWLVTGKIDKVSSVRELTNINGKSIYDEVMANGGRPVLRRILDAYGFTLQKQLCELLNISSGTVSTWIRRNYFPGDVVVACALDTGIDLYWLATGRTRRNIYPDNVNSGYLVERKVLDDGILSDKGKWEINLDFIPHKFSEPYFITVDFCSFIVDFGITSISNGCWLLSLDGKYDIYDVALIPGQKIKVTKNDVGFICSIGEVNVHGKVVLKLEYVK